MTLPASGALTLENIQTEFGGASPISLSEYYAGGGYVPPSTSGTYGAVPTSGTLSVQNFYGTSNYIPVYVEELFSTYTYTGNGATQTITNGIDLAGKGGLVWIKSRTNSGGTGRHSLWDTARGRDKTSVINDSAQDTGIGAGAGVTSFNASGFSLGTPYYETNINADSVVSWTFRKQPKFFDVVTFTQTGTSGTFTTFNHNLGSAPGMVLLKATGASYPWFPCYHRSLGNDQYLVLNQASTAGTFANTFSVNSTSVTVNNNLMLADGATYVAYLFAHNAGGFGLTGTDNVISCGGFTAAAPATVDLGYEPQWVLVKDVNAPYGWGLIDSMRGFAAHFVGATSKLLSANTSNAEVDAGGPYLTPTGFTYSGGNAGVDTIIYIAIRGGAMKVPTDGTKVFVAKQRTGTNVPSTITGVGFAPDLAIVRNTDGYSNWVWTDRKTGFNRSWNSAASGPINSYSNQIMSLDSDGMTLGANYYTSTMSGPYVDYYFKRALKVFDIVTFTGTSAVANIPHNLQTAPQLILFKNDYYTAWQVYAEPLGNNKSSVLNENTAAITSNFLNNTTPTATQFTVSSNYLVNYSGALTTAYLFATCPGVSKVGSFVGNGADNRFIDCGFTGGARFVLIKANATGFNWCVFNHASGMTSSNSPFLSLNSSESALQSQFSGTLWQTAGGFSVKASGTAMNQLDYTYIYLAIA